MECPKSLKDCSPLCIARGGKKSFICSGRTTKPHKYRFDTTRLCLKGKYADGTAIEMTKPEALEIVLALLQTFRY